MDHSTANMINPGNKENHIITSNFSSAIKEEALQKGEKHMHNKEQQMLDAYFKEIADKIAGYDEVLLFGPTNAKVELYHYLQAESRFKQVKIDLEPADKMTENEKNAFVKKHFGN